MKTSKLFGLLLIVGVGGYFLFFKPSSILGSDKVTKASDNPISGIVADSVSKASEYIKEKLAEGMTTGGAMSAAVKAGFIVGTVIISAKIIKNIIDPFGPITEEEAKSYGDSFYNAWKDGTLNETSISVSALRAVK